MTHRGSHRLRSRRPAAPLPQFRAPRADAPRVVVEDEDTARRRATVRRLRAAGYETVDCGGPDALSRRRCPLEEGGVCAAIRDADVVVTSLGEGTVRQVTVLTALRRQYPDLPVVVRTTSQVAHRQRHLLEGCEVQIGVGTTGLSEMPTTARA